MSLIGGGLMEIDIRMPFYIVAVAALVALVLLAMTWGGSEIRKVTSRSDGTS
jgi:hypothetical protein